MSTAGDSPEPEAPSSRPLPLVRLFVLSILAAMILGLLLGNINNSEDKDEGGEPDGVSRRMTPGE
jgi:hypothetical protein